MLFKKKNVVHVLKLSGVLASSGKKSLNIQNVKKNIDSAFEKKISALALIINSPGGSPVQSEIIANYILQKSKETKIPVITFVEDVAASGGYWLAVAGESIFALSKSSIVGSLGVLYAGFGLEELIKKHGIKRRVHTAGKNKVSLDMFQEEKEEDIKRLKEMLAEVHKHFKDWVLSRRGQKITLNHDDLFSGEFWLASVGLTHGLIDGIADLEPKLKELYGEKVKIKYIEPKKHFLAGFSFLGSSFSGKISEQGIIDAGIESLKEQSFWNRFGL
jgi:signal peptide peptidase SppA